MLGTSRRQLYPARAIYVKESHAGWLGTSILRSCLTPTQRRSLSSMAYSRLGTMISVPIHLGVSNDVDLRHYSLVQSVSYARLLAFAHAFLQTYSIQSWDGKALVLSRKQSVGLNEEPSAQHKLRSRTQAELPCVRATTIATHMSRCFHLGRKRITSDSSPRSSGSGRARSWNSGAHQSDKR